MKSEELKGKRLAVFGANNVTEEVTTFARRHGIVLVSVGNVPEAPIHQVSDEQYYMDCTDEAAMLRFFKEKHIDGLLSCSGEMVIPKDGWIHRQDGKSYFPYTKGRVFYDAIGTSPQQPAGASIKHQHHSWPH